MRFYSLFSGCGGFDLGFIAAGYVSGGGLDIDKDACATIRANLESSVTEADVRESLQGVVSAVSTCDVLVAGPPCQGFSTIGKRDEDDPRNFLLPLVAKIASLAKPRAVVVENVAGALSGNHIKHWSELESRLRTAGYKTANLLLGAEKFGLPQARKRALLIAWSTKFEGAFEFQSNFLMSLPEALSIRDGASNHSPVVLVPGSRDDLIARRISQGQKLSNVRGGPNSVHTWQIPEVFGAVGEEQKRLLELMMRLRRKYRSRENGEGDPLIAATLSAEYGADCRSLLNLLLDAGYVRKVGTKFDLTGTFNGKYRRLALAGLSPTVDTRFGQPKYFLHPTENRGLSVREAARIQGFPDHYSFVGSVASQFRQIGNAVPPPMAESIAIFLRGLLTQR
ncbi:MAG: DNA cytosine methyltransferase [Burkholderiales bacterium]|jgi:DNA (cytosine-5)-methyltransferase 1|nr:DNA cytosine methyltransferase [Betaproteobacteria bacterium]